MHIAMNIPSDIVDTDNEVFVSSVSFLEIAIKYRLKRLELPNIDILKIPFFCKMMGFEFSSPSPLTTPNAKYYFPVKI